MGGGWSWAAAGLHAFQGACAYGWLVFLLALNGGERCRGEEGQPVDEVGGTTGGDNWQINARVQGWSRGRWGRKRRKSRVNSGGRSGC